MAEKQLDLLQTLFSDWVTEQREEFAAVNPDDDPEGNLHFTLSTETVQKFVERAREMLQENQPVSMEYLDSGFAIRFQDNSVVPFVIGSKVAATGGNPGAVPVSNPAAKPERGMQGSPSWGVTGDPENE